MEGKNKIFMVAGIGAAIAIVTAAGLYLNRKKIPKAVIKIINE